MQGRLCRVPCNTAVPCACGAAGAYWVAQSSIQGRLASAQCSWTLRVVRVILAYTHAAPIPPPPRLRIAPSWPLRWCPMRRARRFAAGTTCLSGEGTWRCRRTVRVNELTRRCAGQEPELSCRAAPEEPHQAPGAAFRHAQPARWPEQDWQPKRVLAHGLASLPGSRPSGKKSGSFGTR